MATKNKQEVVDFTSMTAIEGLSKEWNELEASIATIEDKIAPQIAKIDAAKERIKEVRALFAEALKAQGRHNVFVDGFLFTFKHNPPSFEVANEELALKWATENHCLKLDTAKAKTLLRREILTPGGFVRSDSITVSRSAEKEIED